MSARLSRVLFVLQDGAQFYNEETGELVAEFPHLVAHDYDMEGATLARETFRDAFPGAVFLADDGSEHA